MDQPRPGEPGWLRPLGGTGLQVSAVCAGAGPLGSLPRLYGREVSADEGVATVRAVIDSPIRVIDTSNNYSDGESERRIGTALAQVGGRPDGLVVVTKVDARGRDFSGARVRESLAESRDRLGLDVLPLVHLHDPENFEFAEIAARGGAVDTLVALKEEGLVGAIGLAGGRVQEMSRYLDLGVFDVLMVHNRWTLVDRSAGALLAAARERGLGVLNAAVYGGGILAGGGAAGATAPTYGYRAAPAELVAAIDRMRRVCSRYGTDLGTAALQFSLRDPGIASTVVGMSRPTRVRQTLDAAAQVLPDALWEELADLLPPDRLWLDAPFD